MYPLYALLFADSGLSEAEISALFALWSVVGVVAEVPTGALADRFSRRSSLVAGGVLQAAGYLLWTAWPGFTAFAAGFVLWGLGATLVSGALEALIYDGLAEVGAQKHFTRVYGQVNALELIAQIPAAGAATVLFVSGGFELVGYASVGMCLLASAIAARLPEPERSQDSEPERGYFTTLRSGVVEAVSTPGVRGVVVVVALLTAVDAIEEYFPLLAHGWNVPASWNPLAVVGIAIAGAAGAAMAGRWATPGARTLAVTLGAGALALGGSGLLAGPAGLAGVALFYGLYRAVLVVGNARLQERIRGEARATVTSVSGLCADLASLVLFGVWALGGLAASVVLVVVVAVALPFGLRRERAPLSPGDHS
ncbi:MFS transporter [Prauserella marina]|uniref:MFS transporter n=1 Tax=Prauserella marina TaxID=530584 RepID=UPI00210B4B21|nr:MFS transporter [Prauserella marina]